jgi:hypothetical protein
MAIYDGLEAITHNFRLSIARQRRSWYNALTPQRRFELLVSIVMLVAGAYLLYLMRDLEGSAPRMATGYVAAVIGLVLVTRSPDMLIGLILLINSSIFGWGSWASRMLRFNVFDTADLLLGVLMVFAFWEFLRERKEERPKADAVMVATLFFYVITLFMMLYAVTILDRVWEDAWGQYGRMCHYLLILAMVVYLRRSDRARAYMWVLFILAIASAIQTYYFFFFGSGGWGELFGLVDVSPRGAGLAARLPSSMLMLAMGLLCVALYLHAEDEKKRWLYFVGCLVFVVAVAMNKGRNAYVGFMLGTTIAWAFAPRPARWRAFRDFFWLGVIVLSLAVVIPPLGAKLLKVGADVGTRFYQTFDPYEYSEGGYRDRMREVEQAWPKFTANPIIGQGPGTYLRRSYQSTPIGTKKIVFQEYMHNSYVYLLATGGLVVIVPFAVMLVAWLWAQARRVRRIRDPVARGVTWGALAFLAALLASSWVQPNFFLVAPVTTTAAIVGLAEALGRKDLEEQSRLAAAGTPEA